MNILKAENGTVRFGAEENDKATDYSKFVFYGIHTMTFVRRTNSVTASEPEVALQAMLGESKDSFEDR